MSKIDYPATQTQNTYQPCEQHTVVTIYYTIWVLYLASQWNTENVWAFLRWFPGMLDKRVDSLCTVCRPHSTLRLPSEPESEWHRVARTLLHLHAPSHWNETVDSCVRHCAASFVVSDWHQCPGSLLRSTWPPSIRVRALEPRLWNCSSSNAVSVQTKSNGSRKPGTSAPKPRSQLF